MRKRLERLSRKTSRIIAQLELSLGVPVPPKRVVKPLHMLVATVLSQNTNDKNSHRAYLQLRQKYPAWKDVLNAPTREIAAAIRPGGMAQKKSKFIKRMLSAIADRFGTLDLGFLRTISDDEVSEILLSLDGVGVKTAACVLLFSLKRNIFPVDTHVHRVCGRLGLAPHCTTPEKTFERMRNSVPAGKAYSFHINLIRFGRKICRASSPLCGRCPLYTWCVFPERKKFLTTTGVKKMSNKDYEFMLLDHV